MPDPVRRNGHPSANPVTPFGAVPEMPFRVVAIGVSLGGPDVLRTLLKALPAAFPVPILIVQHLSPTFVSTLPKLLGRETALHVKHAEHLERMRPGTVYIAPPDRHLMVSRTGRYLRLSDAPKVNFCRPAVDPLLESVARAYGEKAIAVVLTGRGRDGSQGGRLIAEAGGRLLVQEPATCRAPDMPLHAVQCSTPDFVVPLRSIANALIAYTMAPGAADFFRVGKTPISLQPNGVPFR